MEKRTCSFCNKEKTLSDFYTNSSKGYSSICKECTSFQKKAHYLKDKFSKEDYEKWYEENRPKKIVISKLDRLRNSKLYECLVNNKNVYVKNVTQELIDDLQTLLNTTIYKRDTLDKDGYVLYRTN